MKAIEKEKTRRYATASDLAADIERHLRDEPVLAGPPSAIYRIGKFVRKNRAPALAALAVFAALLLEFVASLILYGRSEANRRLAVSNEAEARGADLPSREGGRDPAHLGVRGAAPRMA